MTIVSRIAALGAVAFLSGAPCVGAWATSASAQVETSEYSVVTQEDTVNQNPYTGISVGKIPHPQGDTGAWELQDANPQSENETVFNDFGAGSNDMYASRRVNFFLNMVDIRVKPIGHAPDGEGTIYTYQFTPRDTDLRAYHGVFKGVIVSSDGGTSYILPGGLSCNNGESYCGDITVRPGGTIRIIPYIECHGVASDTGMSNVCFPSPDGIKHVDNRYGSPNDDLYDSAVAVMELTPVAGTQKVEGYVKVYPLSSVYEYAPIDDGESFVITPPNITLGTLIFGIVFLVGLGFVLFYHGDY